MTITAWTRSGVWMWVFAVGCLSGPASDGDADSELALDDASCNTTIRGTGRITGVTDSGLVHAPMDLSGIELASFTNVHGQLIRNDGVGNADGTFSVPVPRGANSWELLGADFIQPIVAVGDARHPTLDQTVLGRLDGVFATAETDVTFAVTGLEPWVSGADTTELTVGNNGGVIFSPEGAGPADGSTTLTSTFDWSTASAPSPLVDASKGDRVVLSQLTARTSGSESYQALANAGTAAPDYNQSEGVPSTLAIAMSPAPQTHMSLRWRGDSFDALTPDVGEGAVSFVESGGGAFIDALPDADRFGFYGFSAPDLLIYFPTDITADIRIDASYGNPYRSRSGKRWDEFMTMFYTYTVPIQLGSALPGRVFASYQSNRSIRQLDGVVKPRISPPRHIRFSGDQLRWDSPSLGHATQYIVTIETLSVSAGKTVATSGMSFWTKDHSLRIPELYLPSGTSFVAFISAVDFGDVDRTKDFNGDSLPFDAAPAVSSTFTR